MAGKSAGKSTAGHLVNLADLAIRWPWGTHVRAIHDDFNGRVVGWYVTREGKEGLAIQQAGTKIVHIYGAANVEVLL